MIPLLWSRRLPKAGRNLGHFLFPTYRYFIKNTRKNSATVSFLKHRYISKVKRKKFIRFLRTF
ncbi:MAG: hypothetical protein D4R56_06535 [Deltaproteobacteria bacterium]|nr:MAG: hypothetical protein D4R56_06535 [Deltaproteobacteria bacterium]